MNRIKMATAAMVVIVVVGIVVIAIIVMIIIKHSLNWRFGNHNKLQGIRCPTTIKMLPIFSASAESSVDCRKNGTNSDSELQLSKA